MKYGSVCSGIEAASKAWEPLGWKPAWFSEIEPFPSAILAHHWPEITNLGDMTQIADAVRTGNVEAPDVLVGGTPCQAFSIAGLREGLSDDRGQLTLSYVELANAIDAKRRERGEPEAIIVWGNVPGVLSSKDNAFGCFLAGLAGESSELQPAGGKWTHAGCVSGPERVIAWRVLDAQFFGVAQRRRRVFVVASARKGFDPAAVLFELDSVRRDSAPRRETQKAVAALTARGVGTCGADDNQAQAGHLIAECANGDVSHTLKGEGFDGSEDGTGRGVPVVAFGGGNTSGNIDVATACTAHGVRMDFDTETFAVHGTQDPDTNRELAHTLGRNNGQENAIVTEPFTLAIRGRSEGSTVEVRNDGTANALLTPNGGRAGMGVGAIGWGMQVRRLTPIECERLQGFPDNHTLIGWRGKDADECPDGPRYKAIGNSMAVPVMRWIGERIAAALPVEVPAPRNWQRPFLKWAGGKYSLLPELDRLIPAGKRLVEPFVGGGSVFLNSEKHESYLLADVNADLINLYQMLEVDHIRVCSLAKILFERANSEEAYKELRDEFNNQRMGAPESAAAFLFLNRHCFNGLIRYNRDGFFNVGWGKYEAPYFPEIEIKAFKQKSHKCVFLNAGYRRTLALAGEGDVVYCDPPYEPLPGTAGFTNYAAGGFSWADQISLAESCVAAHQRGAKVLISNSTAPRVIELYEQHGFTLHHVRGRRAISSKGSARETAKDIVATLGV
ncbi:BsuMI modification methylase subunit ydiP [Enterobacter hormaechei]|uniref:Dam family site-specific DNA-(adenine-N6)-methyltransferase n=1 Tax=Enterobacter hormaechei TaxID=158836 RepID=UPI000798AF13|nr:Dam family site-specific DNA-(adenine-N6)-methyltransferase [Enterobacter hormaechei]SAB03795.1 DMT family permease [Enterobacter hormaechei]VAG35264.1 BsuMI modification methylase subunit ydiP [Enterobacter hormaechei]VAG86387.1 BsuMI modification methylase subunit ydiP [Enterobacter hormaechei]VAK38753.1 BsuMI modification methylase subunit ydiP [Enterobacter hormaechei]VAK51969.1 BsuMI modification methylase subunit ydiP [Enterobacter hormaechei]